MQLRAGFEEIAVNSGTNPFARRSFVFCVAIKRVKSQWCVICVDGRLHFREQNKVHFKLHPCIDGLKPFAAINVSICVGEASRAPVV